MKLYGYFRSTAAYRVRIALHLKGIAHTHEEVHLIKDGGEQHQAAYKALNPQGLVPALEHEGEIITQSLSILEYLEALYPTPALYPKELMLCAKVRAFALSIACDIHPLNNLRVLQYLKQELAITDEQKSAWYQLWIAKGFAALEAMLPTNSSPFCFGDTLTVADVCLIPQIYNAKRFECSMEDYPKLAAIDAHCQTLEAFEQAHPDKHKD